MNLEDELAQEPDEFLVEDEKGGFYNDGSDEEINELDFEHSVSLRLSGMNYNADTEIEEEEDDIEYIEYTDNNSDD